MSAPAFFRALALALILSTGVGATGSADAAEEQKVSGVELHLPPGTDPAGLAERIAVRKGHPLSRREVRRSMERLFATGRFADVVVRSFPTEDGGIRVVFEVTPKRRIASLEVLGARILTPAEVLAAARLVAGEECYPELLDEASGRVAQLYRRKGHRDAHIVVELRDVPAGQEVVLTIEEREPTKILGVTVGGNPGLPVSRVEEALGVGVGEILNQDDLDAGLERLKTLYRQEGFYRARVGEAEILDGKQGATIALPITAGPRYEFRFHGNRSFPDKMLRSILGFDGTEALDEGVTARMERRLAKFYRYRGFHDVRVTSREVRSPNRSKAIVAFDVEEGPLLFVEEVRFEGNQVIPEDLLLQILERQIQAGAPVAGDDVAAPIDPVELAGRDRDVTRVTPPPFEPRRVWVTSAWEDAARSMAEAYRERGYLKASVELQEAEIDVARGAARVTFRISEGPQSRIAGIGFPGLPPGFDPWGVVQIRTGEPFRKIAVEDSSRSLVRALGRGGYLFARVDGESRISPDGKDVTVSFKVESGPKVRVGQVIVRGLKRTEEEMVRANLVVKEGGVLDPESLFESQRNLMLMGSFRSAAVKLISPDVVEEAKDVVVEVRERPRISGEVGGGYSLVDGPRLVGDLVYPNLVGSGMSLSGRVKLNYVGASAQVLSGGGKGIDPSDVAGFDGVDYRGNASLTYPRIYALLPAKLGARLDLIGERAHRPSYTFQRLAAVTGLDWEAWRWLTFSLQYELEHEDVRLPSRAEELLVNLGPMDRQRLRFPSGDFPLHSIRPSFALDFRDDLTRPTRGILLTGSAELTNDFGAILTGSSGEKLRELPIHTVKLAGALTGYVPVAPRTVLALSARGGKIVHLTEDSESIAPKRFFLGGSTSMRGFSEEGVIAEDRRAALRDEVKRCGVPYSVRLDPCINAQVLGEGRELPSEGGELYTLLKSELRLPAFGPFDLGLFFEAGNLWLDPNKYDPLKLRYIAGAGVRYGTPIGPIALDLGVNLFPDQVINEPRANVHFSIGLF